MSRTQEPANPAPAYKRAKLSCAGRNGTPHGEYLLAEIGFYSREVRQFMVHYHEAAHGYEDGVNLGFDPEELFPLYTVSKKSYDIVETTPNGSHKIRLKCGACKRDLQLTEERFITLLYGLAERDPMKALYTVPIECVPG